MANDDDDDDDNDNDSNQIYLNKSCKTQSILSVDGSSCKGGSGK